MKKIVSYLKDEDSVEKIIGGIFGIIAIVAIIIEMAMGNFESSAIVGGIKDIAGTLITVVMLIVAIKALKPKKEEPFSFEKELKTRLEDFVVENSRMLKLMDSNEGNRNFYELYMETDFKAYFGKKSTLRAGWFMRIPPVDEAVYAQKGIKMTFHLNQGTFFGHNKPADETAAFAKIGETINEYLLRETDERTLICQYNKSDRTIEIEFNKPLTTKEDVALFISLIQKVYKCYLVLGESDIK